MFRVFLAMAIVCGACSLSAAKGGFGAEAVLNLFIAQYSAGEISWQREIAIEDGNVESVSGRVKAPRKVAVSQVCGLYSYRPATWAELDAQAREEILRDPRLLPWIKWFASGRAPAVPLKLADVLESPRLGNMDNAQKAKKAPARIPTGGAR